MAEANSSVFLLFAGLQHLMPDNCERFKTSIRLPLRLLLTEGNPCSRRFFFYTTPSPPAQGDVYEVGAGACDSSRILRNHQRIGDARSQIGFLSPLRGWILKCQPPRLAPWAELFRSFGASDLAGLRIVRPNVMSMRHRLGYTPSAKIRVENGFY